MTNEVKCGTATVVSVKRNAGTSGGVAATRVEKSCFVFLYNTVLPPLPPELGGCRLGGGLGLRPRKSAAADRGDGVRGEAGRGGGGRGEAARRRAGSSSARAGAPADTSSASEPGSSELDDEGELDEEEALSLRRSRLRSAGLATGAGRVRPQEPQRIKISNRPRLFTVDWSATNSVEKFGRTTEYRKTLKAL